jgi:hypothetical protein
MEPLITMIVPYYRQPKMLAEQLITWADYSADVRDAFRFTVVDDCSPESAHEVLDLFALNHEPAPFVMPCISLYRIDKDVPWNRGMARNLGTKMATTPWVLHVDTDHVLPPASAHLLLKGAPGTLKKDRWFRFERWRMGAADETRKKDKADPKARHVKIHPHIDSYLCTPEAYWRAGGYNEDFSGVLGGGSPFLKEMERANGEPAVLPISLDVYTRDLVPDSSEHTLPRDPEAFKRRKAEIMKARGTLRGHDPIRLPWHKVF